MTTEDTQVHAERHGHVLILTLDGPTTRNAVGPAVYPALQNHIVDAELDPDIGAIVLTGANGFFSSGGNVRALKASGTGTLSAATGNTDKLNALILAISQSSLPVIAAVEGGAAGAGFSIALACDMIFADHDARFTAAYVRVGLSPDGGASHALARMLPRQLASEMLMLGRTVAADRLHGVGVVNDCVPSGQVRDTALSVATTLASGPRRALGTIKQLIGAAGDADLATHLATEARAINLARFGPEAAEGLAAFLEKRKANFWAD